MEAVLSRLRGLSADELREEFARADVKCGPITATTRATFERKLARVLAGPENSTTGTENCSTAGILGSAPEGADHAKPGSAVAATRSSPAEAGSDDVDFGYGMGLNPPEEDEVSVKTSSNSTAEVSNSQYKTETPFKTPAQVSPTYYGVCPPWDDVLAKTGKLTANNHESNCFLFVCLFFTMLGHPGYVNMESMAELVERLQQPVEPGTIKHM